MGVVIDLMQWVVIIYLMVMLFLTTRKMNRLQRSALSPPIQYTMFGPPPEEPKAVCGCDHHKCFHDENGCGHTSDVDTFGIFGAQYYKSVRCECKGYMGPEHLPQVIP